MTASTEQPAAESAREAGPLVSELEELIREYIRDAIGKHETAGSAPALAFGAEVSITDLLDDMIAKIDRNLELADAHLSRA